MAAERSALSSVVSVINKMQIPTEIHLLPMFCIHSWLLILLVTYQPVTVKAAYSLGSIDVVGPSYEAEETPVALKQLLLSSQLLGAALEPSDSRQQQQQDDLQQDNGGSKEIYLLEDKDYPKSLYERFHGVGQVSGITTLPSADVAIFHRADREWTDKTFDANYTLRNVTYAQDNLIKNDTIMIIDGENGSPITSFGANLFSIPHSIASDNLGNLWVTDVGRHQVMRLPTSMMQLSQHYQAGQRANNNNNRRWLPGNLTRLWPDIVLGEAFVPGSDYSHFCQPSEVKVSSDGRLVYVADGYCNQRIMVYTGSGKFLTSFGEREGFNVVHSLTLMEDRNLICAADRENERILCFRAGLDGDLNSIGELAVKLKYPLGRVFAIEALTNDHMLVASNQVETSRFDLAALNPFKSELKQTWTSSDLLAPHALARTRDGLYAYAADLSKDNYKKVFKFDVIQRKL